MKFENNNEIFTYRTLSTRVLAVAVINKRARDFSVYIDGVNGKNHDNEYINVARNGAKLDKKIANILFPTLFEKYTWRE